MERLLIFHGKSFDLQSIASNGNGGCDIFYWTGKRGRSELEKITTLEFVTLKTDTVEIIKILDFNRIIHC